MAFVCAVSEKTMNGKNVRNAPIDSKRGFRGHVVFLLESYGL